ncbi:MAG: hypothetical protein AB7Q00_16380 [Phycisphaerales bacterium]
MAREAFDMPVIHILCRNPRQVEPMNEVFSSGGEHAPGSAAVSQGDELELIGRASGRHWSEVFGNWNAAVIFEEANEPADIGDVPRSMSLLLAVDLATIAQALTSMACKALNDSGVHLFEWNATQPQPVEKMASCTGAGCKGWDATLGLEIFGQESRTPIRCATRTFLAECDA